MMRSRYKGPIVAYLFFFSLITLINNIRQKSKASFDFDVQKSDVVSMDTAVQNPGIAATSESSIDSNEDSVASSDKGSVNTAEESNQAITLAVEVEEDPKRKQWCPNASCGFNGRCDLCQRRFLIVLASHGVPSTTLTWMLDRLPGVRMTGDNDNLLHKLNRLERETIQSSHFGLKDAWGRNPVPEASFGCFVQELIEVSNPPRPATFVNRTQQDLEQLDRDTIVGFKTVHFHENHRARRDIAKRLVSLLQKYFPCARFVVNIHSNDTQIVDSQQLQEPALQGTSETGNQTPADTAKQETNMLRVLAKMLGEQAMLIDSSEWTQDIQKLNHIVEWLGFGRANYFTELLDLNATDGFKSTQSDHLVSNASFVPEELNGEFQEGGVTVRDDSIKSWCPQAACGFNGRCDLCQRRFLIIIASGRSASTTLTWMLNALPKVRMTGENDNVLRKLRLLEQETIMSTSVGRKDDRGRNPIPRLSFGCAVQELLELSSPPPPQYFSPNATEWDLKQGDRDTIIGFKTIRFHKNWTVVEKNPDRQVEAKVRFLRDYFPCARFVVNIRSDVEAQFKSREKLGWDDAWSSRSSVERETRVLRQMSGALGDQAMLIDSSEWTQDVSKLTRLLEWLGFNEACYFSELLELNTPDSSTDTKTELELDPACQLRSDTS